MKIFNKNDIRLYVRGFCKDGDLDMRYLLQDCLENPLRFHLDCLEEITSLDIFPNGRVKHKFNQRSEPWFKFTPSEDLDFKVQRIADWISEFLDFAGNQYNGGIRMDARAKAKAIKSIEEALRKTNQRFLNEDEYEAAYHKRIIRKDEQEGDIEHISELHARCHLYRIVTPRGADIAGRKAKNCLGDSQMPDGSVPVRILVKNPENDQFYTARDPDGKSLFTIGVHIPHGKIWAHGNGRGFPSPPVPDHAYHLLEQAVDIIHERLPQLRHNRPYGTQPSL